MVRCGKEVSEKRLRKRFLFLRNYYSSDSYILSIRERTFWNIHQKLFLKLGSFNDMCFRSFSLRHLIAILRLRKEALQGNRDIRQISTIPDFGFDKCAKKHGAALTKYGHMGYNSCKG